MFALIVVITLFFSCIVAVFTLQNSDPIAIQFLFWTFHKVPLVIIMLGFALFGALLTFVFSLRKSLSMRFKIRDLSKRLDAAEKRNNLEQPSVTTALPPESGSVVTTDSAQNKEGGADQD